MTQNTVGTFLLGVIAAVVIFMLWRKENGSGAPGFQFPGVGSGMGANTGNGCGAGGCGGSCSTGGIGAGCSPSGPASPSGQSSLASVGLDGQISPGTPPLNSVTGGQGATSFYTVNGVTPDTTFTFSPVARNLASVGSPSQPGGLQTNVPGSATTPAALTPVRATQQVPGYQEGGFVQRYNVVGVPRTVLSTGGYLQ